MAPPSRRHLRGFCCNRLAILDVAITDHQQLDARQRKGGGHAVRQLIEEYPGPYHHHHGPERENQSREPHGVDDSPHDLGRLGVGLPLLVLAEKQRRY